MDFNDFIKERIPNNNHTYYLEHPTLGIKLVEKKTDLKNGIEEMNILKDLNAFYFPTLLGFEMKEKEASLFLSKIHGVNLAEIKSFKTSLHKNVYQSILCNQKMFFRNAIKALFCLHNRGFVHKDIKPSNIIVDEEMNVYLIDFGCACRMDDDACIAKPSGTLEFMAPEALLEPECFEESSDMYSLGRSLQWIFEERPKRIEEDILWWLGQLTSLNQDFRKQIMKDLKLFIANL